MPLKASVLLAMFVIIALCFAGWFWFRGRKPIVIAAEKLSYPCLRIVDGSVWDRIDRVQDLKQIGSDRFMNRRDDPLVIDSEFQVYEMSEFKMRGSTLTLLVTGPRRIDVEFKLIARRDKSVPDAKRMIHELIVSKVPSDSVNDHSANEPDSNPISLRQYIELLEAPVYR